MRGDGDAHLRRAAFRTAFRTALRRDRAGFRGARDLLAGLLVAAALLWAVARLAPLPARLAIPGATTVYFRDGTPAFVSLAPDDRWRIPVKLDEVDPVYLEELIRLEDRRFFYHPGIDPVAVVRAIGQNLRRGRVVSGASTLTMQLVRVLEPRPRTFASKLIETVRALQLELRFSKRELLEAYLRYIPFGRNVEGIEAASIAYFGHRVSALSPAEVATLLAVPQDPGHRYPTPGHERRLRRARDSVARRLHLLGRVQEGRTPAMVLEDIVRSEVPTALRPFPRLAPHAASWLKRRYSGRERIMSTLEVGIQRSTERIVRNAAADAGPRGVHNAAVVVVNHRTLEVVAAVGNPDFWDLEHGGQIEGFDVRRSVGSTLKPFLYAMAIDQGIALPDQRVLDVPVQFATFNPHNYDNSFEGLVRLEDALSRSLNIPFMLLLQELGVERFIGGLRQAGVTGLSGAPGHYGLPAVAGGIELTPLELAGLYATLAEGGLARPLRWLRDDSGMEGIGHPLFSPGAAWLTRRALALRDRPDFPARRHISGIPANIHWKTGTSFGHRDAWAAGSGPVYTAVVWMGNFSARPSAHLVGAELAAPVLFDLIEGIDAAARYLPPAPPPPDLQSIEVCAWSGFLPTEACETRKQVLARASSVPTRRCPFHVRLDVDAGSGLALSPECRAGRRYRSETFTRLPTRVLRWMQDHDRSLAQPPAFVPGCEPGAQAEAPTILSPAPGQTALLIAGLPADRQEIPLEAESSSPTTRLSWFVDGSYLGSARPDERLWWIPAPGHHELMVQDSAGLSATRRVEVRMR